MHILYALAELAEAEYRLPKINARIDAQRQLIEALAFEGHDISSRLRSNLNSKGAKAA